LAFVHVYPETHCNDCATSRIEGRKKKRVTHSRIPIIPDPTTPPFCATVPVVIAPDEPVVVRAAVVVCSVVVIAVVPAAVVPVAAVPAVVVLVPVVSELLDVPPGPVTKVVSKPVSTYTPLKC